MTVPASSVRNQCALPMVAHLIETDGVYGAERVVLELATETSAHARFRPAILPLVSRTVSDLTRAAAVRRIDAADILLRRKWVGLDLPRALSRLAQLRPAILHCHGTKAVLLGRIYRVLAPSTPLVATCHLWFEEPGAGLAFRWLHLAERRAYRRFDAVVAVSEAISRSLSAWGLVHPTTIPNGISRDDFDPSPAPPANHSRVVLLNVGRLAAQKNQQLLVRAVALLRQRGLDVELNIAGEGPCRAELEGLIRDLLLQDSVRLLGFQPEIDKVLKEADLFVMPSLDEGLPIALLEAMASGIPVVATRVGSIPEVLQDGEAGLLVATAELPALVSAIELLVANPTLRRALGSRGRERVRKAYGALTMYEAYAEIYHAAVFGGENGVAGSAGSRKWA